MIVSVIRSLFSDPKPKPKPPAPSRVVPREEHKLEWPSFYEYDATERQPPDGSDPELVQEMTQAVFDHFRHHKDDLPAFPRLAQQIFDATCNPSTDTLEIVRLVQQDPLLAAKILNLANSALESRAIEVQTMREAVVRLGRREVGRMVSTMSARTLFDMETRAALEAFAPLWGRLWSHATLSARASGWLAMSLGRGRVDVCFLAGLLHDVGKAIALRAIGAQVITGAWSVATEKPQVIEEVLERTHVDLGSEMLIGWGLPAEVIDICLDHHANDADTKSVELQIVRLTSAFLDIRGNARHPIDRESEAEQSMASLRVTPQRLCTLSAEVRSFEEQDRGLDR